MSQSTRNDLPPQPHGDLTPPPFRSSTDKAHEPLQVVLAGVVTLQFHARRSDAIQSAACRSLTATVSMVPAGLAGVERLIYAEVEGQGRRFAIVEREGPDEASDRAQATPVVRFELSDAQIAAVVAGAEFGFGIDDPDMRVAHTLKRQQRAALLAELT